MESSQLTKAHEHVRNAATATFSSSIVTAGAEHELAASAFRDAARDTHNDEALRILRLLESHHHQLSQLIKEPPRKKEKSSAAASQASDATTTSSPASAPVARASSPSNASSPTRVSSRRRLPQSSIASNLAEKRGIPGGARRGTPTSGPVSMTNALATHNEQPSTPVRDLLQRQQSQKRDESSRSKEDVTSRKDLSKSTRDRSLPPEDNFRRFYSAFGGVISAISAPLAFTSLPLNPSPPSAPEEPEPTPPTKTPSRPLDESRTIKSSEPDLAALISKPALQALREDPSGALGPFANNESFYFVPTSGGTLSYANILRDQQQHPHHAAQNPHLPSISEGASTPGLRGSSHEEFVDARENLGPPSPTSSRRPRSTHGPASVVTTARSIPAGRGTGAKTPEEIALENEELRSLIDKQAKRLLMWETSSQSSYSALAQSFRARPPNLDAPSSPPPLPPPDAAAAAQKVRDLEALLVKQKDRAEALERENEGLVRQNEKNGLVLGRYREQWEKLKAGARRKEQERRERRVGEMKGGAEGGAGGGKESGSGGDGGEGGKEEGEEGEVVEEAVEETEEAGLGKA
ncbi:hypothetical protein EJ04DRAFT_542772 [Polyplosphaeria fusca]|uniref:Uncharacterized protein n=1 Tax=Polyplosphaeria fusca TaxID=682080 RepID=A0A9P4QXZ2_9PLEO|nr:hypothetical protein EJ04DRAFT_542772 [Polyplosphaeria fusca]